MRRVAAVLLTLTPYLANAEEAPCRPEGDRVSCDRPSFDTLVRGCTDAKAAVKSCGLRLDAMTQRSDESETALAVCLARPAPQPIEPPKAWTRVAPVMLAAVGAAVLTASITSDWGTSGRATGAVVGSAFVGTGIIFTLP